jgi:hypothetical protein
VPNAFRHWVTIHQARLLHLSSLVSAIPSIGCGQLAFDPQVIAEHMLGETYRQLTMSPQFPLTVSFVLQASQPHVFDAFAQQLKILTLIDKDTPTTVPFNKKSREETRTSVRSSTSIVLAVRIKLKGPSEDNLRQGEQEIRNLAGSCPDHLQLTSQTDISDWSQETIEKYYYFCLHRRVIPTLDIPNTRLDLVGPKDAVSKMDGLYRN